MVYFNKKLGDIHKPDVHNLFSGHSEKISCQEEEKYSNPLCNEDKEQRALYTYGASDSST
jgi:hypothetical protein